MTSAAFITLLLVFLTDVFLCSRSLKLSTLTFKSMPRSLSISMSSPSDAKVVFKNLNPSSFAHPIDIQMRSQLAQVPFIESITRRINGLAEDSINLDNLSRGIKVGPNQLPELHKDLLNACSILDIKEIPDLYVRQNPVPNAYTMAVQGKKPFIVLHSSIIDLLKPEELQSVIAHELGHLKCEHGIWITALNILALLVDQFGTVGMFARTVLESQLYEWQRSAEYTCDRAAVLVTQDWKTVARVMLKLSGGSASYNKDLDVDAFLEQNDLYEEAMKKSRIGRTVTKTMERAATHPLPIQRVKELKSFYEGPSYAGLKNRAVAPSFD